MRKMLLRHVVLAVLSCLLLINIKALAQGGPQWNEKTAGEWFRKMEWLKGDRNTDSRSRELTPDASINKVEFAKQYHAKRLWWDEAFAYLKNTDFTAVKPGKYSIDGNNVSVTVYEGPSRLPDTTQWELHRNFEDIHYIFTGKERIGLAPDSSATLIRDYDSARDIAYYTVKGKYYSMPAGTFFIVFTHDVHQPGLKAEGYDKVKRIVIKVRKAL